MDRQGFLEFLEKHYPVIDSRSERYIKKRSEEWHAWVMQETSFLKEGNRFRDRLAAIILGITSQPVCPECDKNIFSQSGIKWTKFCSIACSGKYGKRILRTEYHTDEQWCKDQANRVAEGLLKRHGVDNPMQLPGIMDKIKSLNQEKFGADFHTQTKEGADKISAGLRKVFGSSAGDILREAKRTRILQEYERATNSGDTTYLDKGKIGGKSKTENRFKEMVEEIVGYPLKSKYIKTARGNREIDIFIPDKNIGIEFNGCYSHSEEAGKDKNYHLDKLESAESQNIHLLTVWEDDFLNRDKLPIILDRIRALLGKSIKRVFARNTVAKTVDLIEYRAFLQKHHIQGSNDHAKIRLGLFHQNNLVAVMGFKRCASNVKRYGDPKDVWELCRFASKHSVVGGFSKLINHFKMQCDPRLIYSFGDRTFVYRKSNVYLKNGFVEYSISKPDYWYLDRNRRSHKFNHRKSSFVKKGFDVTGKSEDDLRREAKMSKIWDTGRICYVLK